MYKRKFPWKKLKKAFGKDKMLPIQYTHFQSQNLRFETIYQVLLQTTMLLLSVTEMPTTTGLKGISGKTSLSVIGLFVIESVFILIVPIIWSISSLNVHASKLTEIQKAFIPTKAYIMMLLWTAIVTYKRVLALLLCTFTRSA